MLERLLEASFIEYLQAPLGDFTEFWKREVITRKLYFPPFKKHISIIYCFLAERKYAGSTVMTYSSALSYPHRLAG